MSLPQLSTNPRSGNVVVLEDATLGATNEPRDDTRAIRLEASQHVYQNYEAVCVERNRYFIGMIAALGLAGALVAAIMLMLPLKEVRPFVIRAADTGPLTVVPDADVAALSKDQALTKHWIAQYIQYRENYNWRNVDRLGEFVQSMSSVEAADTYLRFMSPGNAGSPLKRYGRDFERVAQVESVSFLGEPTANGERSAIVRFSATTQARGGAGAVEHWSAIVTFAYLPETLMPDETRLLVNPLGFTVTSYSTTKELG